LCPLVNAPCEWLRLIATLTNYRTDFLNLGGSPVVFPTYFALFV
jgi:hypothetical protein